MIKIEKQIETKRFGIIYIYENKINNKCYVGKTIYPDARKRQHLYDSFTEKSPRYNNLFHKAIRKYGINNFSYTILESNISEDLLDSREVYWINEKRSYYIYGKGYNMTQGGEGFSSITTELVSEIASYLKSPNDKTYSEIADLCDTNTALVCHVNLGKYKQLLDPSINYPIKNFYITEDRLDCIYNLLLNTDKYFDEISEIVGVSPSTISKINMGKLYQRENFTYPLRNKNLSISSIKYAIKLFKTSKFTLLEISSKTGIGRTALRKINNGTHPYWKRKSNLIEKFPLRDPNYDEVVTKEEIAQIKNLLRNTKLSYLEIVKKLNLNFRSDSLAYSTISSINRGRRNYFCQDEKYPIR